MRIASESRHNRRRLVGGGEMYVMLMSVHNAIFQGRFVGPYMRKTPPLNPTCSSVLPSRPFSTILSSPRPLAKNNVCIEVFHRHRHLDLPILITLILRNPRIRPTLHPTRLCTLFPTSCLPLYNPHARLQLLILEPRPASTTAHTGAEPAQADGRYALARKGVPFECIGGIPVVRCCYGEHLHSNSFPWQPCPAPHLHHL